MTDLERVVRPFQITTPPTQIRSKAQPAADVVVTWGTTRTDGQANAAANPSAKKVVNGSFSLSTTLYNKKFPKEKTSSGPNANPNFGPNPNDGPNPNAFDPSQAW